MPPPLDALVDFDLPEEPTIQAVRKRFKQREPINGKAALARREFL